MSVAKHSCIHEWYALVVLLLGNVCRDVHLVVHVFVVEDFSCKFHVVVCYWMCQCWMPVLQFRRGNYIYLPNSPISASSMPRISASSAARRCIPGIRFMMNRITVVMTNEYSPPETESASW